MSRQPLDFYATPAPVIDAILPHLPLGGDVLDPCAGDGAILARLRAWGVDRSRISGIEIDPVRAAQACEHADTICDDALHRNWPTVGLILANPPFKTAHDWAYRTVMDARHHGGTVALLLRLSFLESAVRVAFHRTHPSDVYVLPSRPKFVGRKTDSLTCAWFVFGPGRGGRWSILDVPEVAK